MTNDSIITTNGKKVILHRAYTENADLSATLYLAPSQLKLGIDNDTPLITDTALDYAIPIEVGTANDDGSNTMTGSNGGDNSTDNIITFKEGAGATEATAQNLITTGSNTTKTWTIADLSSAGTVITGTKPFALWLYIKDTTVSTLDKIVSVTVKLGSDSSNYYYKTILNADLSVGWNWLTSNTTTVNALTETGTVAGDIDTFIIDIVTGDSADAFIAGDVVYDLLRTWAATDLVKDFSSGYPSFNYTDNEVTIRGYINSLQANGFLINSLAIVNEDTSVLMLGEDTFAGESKSSSDEFIFVVKDRVI